MTAPEQRTGNYWPGYLDGHAHGIQVGYERGFNARVELEAEARARELLTLQADAFASWAHREAERRHGPAWASMFGEKNTA